MNRLWRLLHHLFGDPPPPRPSGHVPDRLHRGHHRHHEDDEEARRQADDQVADAGDGPAPASHHGH